MGRVLRDCKEVAIPFRAGAKHYAALRPRAATLSGYAKGSPFMMNIARSTENSVLEIRSDYFRHFIEALVEFFKNGTIPAPHSETLSIISAWGALKKQTSRIPVIMMENW